MAISPQPIFVLLANPIESIINFHFIWPNFPDNYLPPPPPSPSLPPGPACSQTTTHSTRRRTSRWCRRSGTSPLRPAASSSAPSASASRSAGGRDGRGGGCGVSGVWEWRRELRVHPDFPWVPDDRGKKINFYWFTDFPVARFSPEFRPQKAFWLPQIFTQSLLRTGRALRTLLKLTNHHDSRKSMPLRGLPISTRRVLVSVHFAEKLLLRSAYSNNSPDYQNFTKIFFPAISCVPYGNLKAKPCLGGCISGWDFFVMFLGFDVHLLCGKTCRNVVLPIDLPRNSPSSNGFATARSSD